ncbi:MAG TPA: IPT/TIG domain-containing protein [Thermoanaerobaculia bacterium]|nr:IPT/TIG domain-containing protein [Thermoanaerobaculia bacterium]
MKPLRIVLHLLSALLLLAAVGCQSDSPTEPSGAPPANPGPPASVTTFTITVTANPPSLTAGSATGSTVTVDVRRTDNGQPPPDLTDVTLTTNLGDFNSLNSGVRTLTLDLVNGRAQAILFPGSAAGTATVQAAVDTSRGVANVQIGQLGTFFLSSVSPQVGSPQGGQEVVILGGGFDGPVRVTFNGVPAVVRSVSTNQIRVVVPSAAALGITVGAGQSVPVAVGVTINLNEPGQATDTLTAGFTYSLGGVVQPVILSVTPQAGTNDGGTRVTITGDGFQSPVQVLFGFGAAGSFDGVEATVLEVTNNRIVVNSPTATGFGSNLTNQLVSILVRNLNTGFTTVSTAAFKYGNRVIITAMGPGSGSYLGGTRVTIFGNGFDEPVAVTLGGIGQTPTSVTGTEVVFITSGIPLTACPANGIVQVNGISVTNIDTGDSGSAAIGFQFIVPLPLIFGVTPQSGAVNSNVTISGQNFAENVQVLFGDPANGSAASIVSKSSTAITVRVPTPTSTFVFATEPCDGNGDGIAGGTRNIPTPITVTVRNLDGTGCQASLSNAFTLTPQNTTCTGDTSTPPPPPVVQCNDGFDNDGDTFIDAADPGCSGPTDNTENTA